MQETSYLSYYNIRITAKLLSKYFMKANEYDQELRLSHTADQPTES